MIVIIDYADFIHLYNILKYKQLLYIDSLGKYLCYTFQVTCRTKGQYLSDNVYLSFVED
jgi:hypothetical protein